MTLFLTRRPGESVKIGDNVTMTVREVHAKKIYVVFEDDGVQYPHWANLYSDIVGCEAKINVTGICGRQSAWRSTPISRSRSCVRSC